MALRNNNTVELKRLAGSSTTLTSVPLTVSTGTWCTLTHRYDRRRWTHTLA